MNLEKDPPVDPVDAALDTLDLDETPDTEEDDLRTDDNDEDEADEAEAKEPEKSDEDDDEDEDEASAKEAKPKKSGRAQKRFDQLTREREDAKRERDYYKSLYEENRFAGNQTRQPTQQEYQQGAQQGFSRQQVEAWVENAAQQKLAEAEFKTKVSKVRETLQTSAPDALARLSNEALTRFHPDAVESLHDARYPAQVAKAIAGSEELFNQFRNATPSGQAALIARIDGRLEARAAQKTRTQPPATPQVRGKTRPPAKNPEDMDQAEYEAWTKKQGF